MSFPIPNEYDMPDVKYNNGDVISLPPSLSGDGTGVNLSQLEKDLILTLFSKAAYAEDDAGAAYDTLENLWTTTTMSITYDLSHVTSSNTAVSIESGQSYTTTLTASDDYTINSVVVTMGGVDITSTAYSSGSVSIPSVTGDIVITATAVSGHPISDETKWTDGVAYTYTGVLNEYVDKTDGSLDSYNAWDRTTFLYCSGASTLTFECVTTNSQGGASNLLYNAFYDANKGFLSAFSLGTNMSTVGNTADVTVPSGAVYFVASGKQSLYAYRDNTGGPFVQITPKA